MIARKSTAWIRGTGATDRARRLRQNETEAEGALWSDLRSRRLNGFKFARQVPLGMYVADFVRRDRNLVVELDGQQHAESESDAARTRWLNSSGYSVLRFWNTAVFLERRSVLDTIVAALDGRLCTNDDNSQFFPATAQEVGAP